MDDEDAPLEIHQPPAHLLTRVASALVLIPLALSAVVLGGLWFALLLAVGGLGMGLEWAMMAGLARRHFILFAGLLAAIAVAFVLAATPFALPWTEAQSGVAPMMIWGASVLTLGLVMAVAGFFLRRLRLGWMGVALIYCWTPVLALAWLRSVEQGLWLVAWTLLVVWGTDIGGYFVGRALGGAKLVPQISPNKTWSGLLGGMILAAAAAAIAADWFRLGPPGLLALAALGLAVIEQAGDLAESAVKRHFGVKDSGRIIPGHGGILDRVDGLVFVAPVVAAAVAVVK